MSGRCQDGPPRWSHDGIRHRRPHGRRYGVAREVEDLRALVAASGATRVFGLSSGALAALRTALCPRN